MGDTQAMDSVPTWRIVLAALLDFFTAFMVFGYAVAALTGGLTEGGFHVTGVPALIVFALIIAYFVVGKRLRGTLWQRILKAYRG